MSVNKVILVGNVGKDPEVRYLDEGNPVAKFSLATGKSYTNRAGEKIEDTSWHNIVIWGKLGQVVEKYVKKGSKLYLEGEISYRSWDDKDGNKHYITEIVCNQMLMLNKVEPSIADQPNGIDDPF